MSDQMAYVVMQQLSESGPVAVFTNEDKAKEFADRYSADEHFKGWTWFFVYAMVLDPVAIEETEALT